MVLKWSKTNHMLVNLTNYMFSNHNFQNKNEDDKK